MSGCTSRINVVVCAAILLSGCAAGPPSAPYPAWIAVDELPDAFVAGLPGSRVKQLVGDARTQRGSYRVSVPADWSFTTGASPGHSVEIFVLAGQVDLGEFRLTAGGYAWLPAGMPGMRLHAKSGALLLYFVDEADPRAVIQTPLITNGELIEWQEESTGIAYRVLREDPGSGARTSIVRWTPEARFAWQVSSQPVEGYLLTGAAQVSECVAGKELTDGYAPGGYFLRPVAALHGGPATRTSAGATWLLRTPGRDVIETRDDCE